MNKIVPAARTSPGLGNLCLRALQMPRGFLGALLGGMMILLALIGSFIAPYSPFDFVAMPFQPPGTDFWLGTDYMGRDVFSRLLSGGWLLIMMGVGATSVAMVVGSLCGLIAGYVGGRIDMLIMRILDIVLAFPERVLVLMFVTVLGANNVILVLATALVFVPGVARAARAATLDEIRNDYIAYTETIGMPRLRVVRTEILPNIATPLLVETGFRLTWSIGLITGISFLGFGTQPPIPEWGLMINESRDGLLFQPMAILAPIICIGLFVIGVNLFADAMARANGRTQ